VYVRLLGDAELYVSGYTDAALSSWARSVRAWARGRAPAGPRLVAPPAPFRPGGRDVLVYFDNDVKVRAPFDAMALAHRLKLGPRPTSPGCARSRARAGPTSARREIGGLCPERLAGAPCRRGQSKARCNPRHCALRAGLGGHTQRVPALSAS